MLFFNHDVLLVKVTLSKSQFLAQRVSFSRLFVKLLLKIELILFQRLDLLRQVLEFQFFFVDFCPIIVQFIKQIVVLHRFLCVLSLDFFSEDLLILQFIILSPHLLISLSQIILRLVKLSLFIFEVCLR